MIGVGEGEVLYVGEGGRGREVFQGQSFERVQVLQVVKASGREECEVVLTQVPANTDRVDTFLSPMTVDGTRSVHSHL